MNRSGIIPLPDVEQAAEAANFLNPLIIKRMGKPGKSDQAIYMVVPLSEGLSIDQFRLRT